MRGHCLVHQVNEVVLVRIMDSNLHLNTLISQFFPELCCITAGFLVELFARHRDSPHASPAALPDMRGTAENGTQFRTPR